MRIFSFWAETHQLSVCLVHCSSWRGRTRVEWFRSFPLAAREEAGPILHQLLAAQSEPASIRVVTSLPSGLVLVRRDRFPTRKRKQLAQLLSYHTDTLVPFPAHERVVCLTSATPQGARECDATVWTAHQGKVSQELAFWAEQQVPLHALCCEPAALHRYGVECSAPDGTYLLAHKLYTCAVTVVNRLPVRSITINQFGEEPSFDLPVQLEQVALPSSL